METISSVFLAACGVWAVSVARHDLASRKITNASILAGLGLLGAGLAAAALWTLLGRAGLAGDSLGGRFYWLFFLNLGLAFLVGVLLWYSEVWPAGDAKFFIVTCAALPLADPGLAPQAGYLFLRLLVNIFVAAGLWVALSVAAGLLASLRRKGALRDAAAALGARLSAAAGGGGARAALAAFLGLLSVFLAQQVAVTAAGGFVSKYILRPEVVFLFLFLLWGKLRRAFGGGRALRGAAALLLALLALGAYRQGAGLAELAAASLGNTLRFGLLALLGNLALGFLLENRGKYRLAAADIAPGVVLTAGTAAALRKAPELADCLVSCFKDGLTERQAVTLRAWLERNGEPEAGLEAVRGKAFAGWILAGAVLTLAFDRNLAALIRLL